MRQQEPRANKVSAHLFLGQGLGVGMDKVSSLVEFEQQDSQIALKPDTNKEYPGVMEVARMCSIHLENRIKPECCRGCHGFDNL